MAYTQTIFVPDYPGAIVVPAFPTNVIDAPNHPRALFLHTPEEPVDDIESTPAYFARDLSPQRASTHFYADSDGDMYQMVPVRFGAVANGLRNKPLPPWAVPGVSLNLQSESIEIEGYAAGMRRTCPPHSRQWNSVVRWVERRTRMQTSMPPILLDRAHVMGHYEVADNRSDPGTLDIDGIVEHAQELRGEIMAPSETDVIKATNNFAGTFEEAAGYMLRQEKMPKGLLDRLQAILNLANR